MEPFVTQCPLCLTSFRVTASQLAAAQGLVRCGSCTHVFHAERHRLGSVTGASLDTGISQAYINSLLATAETSSVADVTPASSMPVAATEPDRTLAPPSIVPMPVEMERRSGRPLAWMRLALGLACVLALLALPAQYVWYQRATLALDATWRPWFEQICAKRDCDLPQFRDASKIRSDQLLIRPAPGRPGVLLMDALITNYAQFVQPFPGLELRFSEMSGRVVASRMFLPKEYLAATSNGRVVMRSRESVQVHIELLDPGETAVNYHLYLHEL